MLPADRDNPNPIDRLATRIRQELTAHLFGMEEAIDLLLIGLLSEGHMLLEGVPGTAKTTLIKCLARLLDLKFQRVQLTPDLLPAEMIGTSIFDLNTRNFQFRRGPVFTDLLLADEINRTPPKTQSALLEAMEEKQVTVDGQTYRLSPMFTVIATLNPLQFEGTYPLPEAQLDRFFMKIPIGYPSLEAEKTLLNAFVNSSRKQATGRLSPEDSLSTIADIAVIAEARESLSEMVIENSLMDYILEIIGSTRNHASLSLGASPRAGIALLSASRAHAALHGKSFVTPDDVKRVAVPVLAHRLLLSPEAELDGLSAAAVIQRVLNQVAVPR